MYVHILWLLFYELKKTWQAPRGKSCKQLLRRLHLRLQIIIEGSNILCFPLTFSFPHLLLSPHWRTKGHFSLLVCLFCSLSASIHPFLSHLLPDEMHTCSNGRIETQREEQMLRQMDGWREVLMKPRDSRGYILYKFNDGLLTDLFSGFVSLWHLWQHKHKLNIKQSRDCREALGVFLFIYFLVPYEYWMSWREEGWVTKLTHT